MKFKKDGTGWRDLAFTNSDRVKLAVSIPDNKSKRRPSGLPFIYILEDNHGTYTSCHLSRGQLRTLANKILKELDR
jgi:hypothetical protein